MVYVFLAHGFEEIEAITPVDVLRRASVAVKAVGVGGKTITGAHGLTVHCDISHKEVSPDKLEMIILPGGMPGTTNLEKAPAIHKVIDFAVKHDLWIAAICAAPSILAHKGLLDGRKATVYPSYIEDLANADYQALSVVQDQKIITANGPGAALPFALKLVEVLTDAATAKQIGDSMQWPTTQ